MNTINTTQVPDSTLDNARNNLVSEARKTGDVIKVYADALCSAFNIVNMTGETVKPWYELKGKEKSGLNIERAKFVEGFKGAGFGQGTIDVYWQRVKEASGYIPNKNRVQGGNSTDDKTLSELKTMINRIFKAEEAGEECKASDYKGALMDIFQGLGGDVDNLG